MMLIKTRVAPSGIHGMGLFAVERVPKGTPIWRFQPGFDHDFSPEQFAALPQTARDHTRWFCFVSKVDGHVILSGDHACFINHCDNPNTGAPENAPALINLALVRQRQKKFDEGDALLKRVLRNDVTNAGAWLLLGIAAYERGNLEAAHAHLAQAVLYAPKNPQAHLYLGITLGRKGWYSAGEDELRRALEINPKFAEAHYNLAVLCMERVPPAVELGRRHYTKALELGAAPDPELARKIGE